MSLPRPWLAEHKALLKEMADRGASTAEIARVVGRSESAVSSKLSNLSIRIRRSRTLSPTQELEVIAWWKARRALGTTKQVAARMGCSIAVIEGILNRMKCRESQRRCGAPRYLENLPF